MTTFKTLKPCGISLWWFSFLLLSLGCAEQESNKFRSGAKVDNLDPSQQGPGNAGGPGSGDAVGSSNKSEFQRVIEIEREERRLADEALAEIISQVSKRLDDLQSSVEADIKRLDEWDIKLDERLTALKNQTDRDREFTKDELNKINAIGGGLKKAIEIGIPALIQEKVEKRYADVMKTLESYSTTAEMETYVQGELTREITNLKTEVDSKFEKVGDFLIGMQKEADLRERILAGEELDPETLNRELADAVAMYNGFKESVGGKFAEQIDKMIENNPGDYQKLIALKKQMDEKLIGTLDGKFAAINSDLEILHTRTNNLINITQSMAQGLTGVSIPAEAFNTPEGIKESVATVYSTLKSKVAQIDDNSARITEVEKDVAEIKNQLTDHLAAVRVAAETLAKKSRTGKFNRAKFIKISVELSELHGRLEGILNSLRVYLITEGMSESDANKVIEEFLKLLKPGQDIGKYIAELKNHLKNTINWNQNESKNADFSRYFKEVAMSGACKAIGSNLPTFGDIGGLDALDVLADRYVSYVGGERTNGIYSLTPFKGLGPKSSNTEIDRRTELGFAILTTMTTPSYPEEASARCKRLIRSFTSLEIRNNARVVHQRLSKDPEFVKPDRRYKLAMVNGKLNELLKLVNEFWKKYSSSFSDPKEAASKFANFFSVLTQIHEVMAAKEAILDLELQLILARRNSAHSEQELRDEFNKLMEMIEGFKENLISRLNQAEKERKLALTAVVSVAMEGGMGDALKGILEQILAAIATDPEDPMDPQIASTLPEISIIQHFFAPEYLRNGTKAELVGVCTGQVIDRDFNARVTDPWGVGYRGQDGCSTFWRDTLTTHQQQAKAASLKLRLFGAMTGAQIRDTYGTNLSVNFTLHADPTKDIAIYGKYHDGVFDFGVPTLLDNWITNMNRGTIAGQAIARYTFNITPVNNLHADGPKTGTAKDYSLRMVSPIVLNFHSEKMIQTSPNQGKLFDMDGDGIKETTGWVEGHQGAFLVMDLNQNGQIDDGTELFGDSTRMPDGSKAIHGFHALTQYDSNKNQQIDPDDQEFDSFLAWFDHNGNTQVDPGELKTLDDLKITAIDTSYDTVPQDLRYQNFNDIRYHSRFYGPKACEATGCRSFDVYFNTGFFVKK